MDLERQQWETAHRYGGSVHPAPAGAAKGRHRYRWRRTFRVAGQSIDVDETQGQRQLQPERRQPNPERAGRLRPVRHGVQGGDLGPGNGTTWRTVKAGSLSNPRVVRLIDVPAANT